MPEPVDDVLLGIQAAARLTFAQPALALRPETTHEDVDGWDSVSHVGFVMEVEKTFNIRFPLELIYAFKDVGEMAAWVRGHRP